MKNYILAFLSTVLLSASAWAQDTIGTTAPVAATAAENSAAKESPKAKEAPIVREKFDPKKDPAADLASAVTMASKSGKRIIIDLGGEWCSWCLYMDKFFVNNPELAKFRDDNFIWLKVNYSEENKNEKFLATYPEAAGYPHLYVLDEKGNFLLSQDTSELEQGKGYNLDKFTAFLKEWAPKKAAAVH